MSARPVTGGRRLISGVPRTAMDMKTGQMTTGAVGIGLNTDMELENKPVTREGMVSVRQQNDMGPKRRYQDETFWISKLREKNQELLTEIENLERESETLRSDSNQADKLSKQHQGLKAEVEELQDNFNNLNLAVERLQAPDEALEMMEEEIKKLGEENKSRRTQNDSILKQKIDTEEKVHQLQRAMDEALSQFDGKLQENPRLRKEFYNLKSEEQALDGKIRTLRVELAQLETAYQQQMDELSNDIDKQRYLTRLSDKKELLDQLHAIKRDIFSIENEAAEEKLVMNNLLNEVKEMKSEKETLTNRNTTLQKELNERLKELNGFTGEIAQNYKNLQEKDKKLHKFLNDFPETKAKLTQSMKKLQEMNIQVLEHIATNISDKENMPSMGNLANMRANLQWKKDEYERSAQTLEGLKRDLERRRKEFASMENLDQKLENDLRSQQKAIHRMTEELKVFNDLDQLTANYEQLFKDMEMFKSESGELRDAMKRQMNSLARTNTHAMKRLQNNPVFDKLSDLENKIKKLEQTNYSLREYIMTKGAETDYTDLKKDANDLVGSLDKLIKEKYAPISNDV
mmetsp:Transcript_1448/g.2197  ORF Transcript_1448/g.2197 Transcript_1448/m.2197 type:complete len:574 (+) Transcript_1448:200-1921(+)